MSKAQGATSGKPNERAPADTGVQITGTARHLASIEQSLKDLPAVDEARVAAVKGRLEDGSYKVDPQRIADRLLRMDRELDAGQSG